MVDTEVKNSASHSVVIIGAGPAGLQMGYFLDRHDVDYVILERDSVASFFRKFPRDRRLISFNKKYSIYTDPEINLRWDWNSLLTDDYSASFTHYSDELFPSSDDLVRYLEDFSRRYNIRVREGVEVVRVRRLNDRFELHTREGGRVMGDLLVVATGLTELYVPDIDGIEHISETYATCSINPDDYRGQRVLIIGKGNSGFELADRFLDTAALIHLASPESVTMAWQTRHPGHLRANYARILDAYQLKTLHGALDAHIRRIEKRPSTFVVEFEYVHADGEIEAIEYDHVILCTGFRFSDRIFDAPIKPQLEIQGRLPSLTCEWESVNVPGMFFCGTLMQSLDFHRSASAFIDGFRYSARSLARVLASRVQGGDIRSLEDELTVPRLIRYIEQRVCRSSSLWTQFSSLCDIICYDPDLGRFMVYQDLPISYHQERLQHRYPQRTVLTFEWGEYSGDVFQIERHPRNKTAYTNVFLHPILRTYDGPKLCTTHHILEDLFGMYSAVGSVDTRQRIAHKSREEYHFAEHYLPLLSHVNDIFTKFGFREDEPMGELIDEDN